jgi:hypothetical protein
MDQDFSGFVAPLGTRITHIDPFLHQVDLAIVEHDFNFQILMSLEEFR